MVRSKDCRPYELTLDVMFNTQEIHEKVENTRVLDRTIVTNLYHITGKDVVTSLLWDQAMAYRATTVRPTSSGGFGETDMHGSQQHAPLLYVSFPFRKEPDAFKQE